MNSDSAASLTVNDFLGLFGHSAEHSRLIAAADSDELLALATYLVQRSSS